MVHLPPLQQGPVSSRQHATTDAFLPPSAGVGLSMLEVQAAKVMGSIATAEPARTSVVRPTPQP